MTIASTNKLVGALRSFIDGLTSGSLASALGAIAFAAAEAVLAILLLTPRNLARIDARYLKESRYDDLAEATVSALRMRFSQSGRRGVVYLGASHANRALFAHGRALEPEISEAAGERVDLYLLSADNEKLGEWPILLDQLPRSFRGVVLLSVCDAMKNFANDATRTKLALASPTLDHPPPVFRTLLPDSVLHPPKRTGVYLLDHLDFFASRRSVLVRLGPAPLRGKVQQRRQLPARHWRKLKRALQRRRGGPPLLDFLPQLEKIIERLKARGIEVVLVEAPVNPRYDKVKPLRASRYLVYEPAMFEFAEQVGVHYWNPSAFAKPKASDFRDQVHMRHWPAEKRWEADLVGRLGRLLRGEQVEDGPATPDVGSRDVAAADDDEGS